MSDLELAPRERDELVVALGERARVAVAADEDAHERHVLGRAADPLAGDERRREHAALLALGDDQAGGVERVRHVGAREADA